MTCNSPVPFDTLVAWWTRELDDAESARVEEHVFECDACAESVASLARLASGIREHIPPILSGAQRDRLLAAGSRIRFTPVEAGVDARAVFDHEVDLLVHVLHADLSRAGRVDVEIADPEGKGDPIVCINVPFEADKGEVLIACQRHYQHLHARGPIFRLYAFEGSERRHVGDFFVEHVWEP